MRPLLNLFVAITLIGVLVPGSTRAVGPDACPDAMSAGRDQERAVGFPKHLDEATGSAVLQAFSDGLMEKHVDRAKIYRNWSKLKKQYLTKIVNADSERDYYDAIREFASEGLNPPVSFLSPYQRNFSAGGNGPTFGGIGAMSIPNPSGGSTVLWVFKDSPLRRAGVQPRDTLLELNGTPCLDPILFRGPVGSTLTVKVRTPGSAPRMITLERDVIRAEVPVRVGPLESDPRFTVIWIGRFLDDDSVFKVVSARLKEQLAAGAMRFILDLRSTGGGATKASRRVLGLFMAGPAESVYGKNPAQSFTQKVERQEPFLGEYPIVVLLDRESSSTAHLMAEAIRSRGNSIVIGDPRAQSMVNTSFIHELPDGSIAWYPTSISVPLNVPFTSDYSVVPDVHIKENWLNTSERSDPYFAAARAWHFPKK
jgi:carboxyl-terminal processing protease